MPKGEVQKITIEFEDRYLIVEGELAERYSRWVDSHLAHLEGTEPEDFKWTKVMKDNNGE